MTSQDQAPHNRQSNKSEVTKASSNNLDGTMLHLSSQADVAKTVNDQPKTLVETDKTRIDTYKDSDQSKTAEGSSEKTHHELGATLASGSVARSSTTDLPTMVHGSSSASATKRGKEPTDQTLDTFLDQGSASRRSNHLETFGNDQRFEILSSHAKGGLGEVFLARDASLDRQVALKEMQSRVGSHPEARERFEFEARVTGNLEHPCVVPVYAIGTHEDGRPFYAMRFIRGVTLMDSIRDFHNQPAPNRKWHSVEFRTLLSRLIAACNGIAFAHNKGVIHRDIKPDNIMLGRYGETLIVDWGLAKFVGQTDTLPSQTDTIVPSISGSNPSMTMEGSAMGTPGYMSPEQAEGKLDELTAATDLFSLGATLYAIITARPPFAGKSAKEVLGKVKSLDFDSPRTLDRTLPKAINAICLKAMARDAADRYDSALALAADLEEFLAGEPVSCFREPVLVRAARWVRKHQTLAVSGALLLLVATVGSLVGMTLIGAEQKRTKAALNQVLIEQERTSSALAAESAARIQTRDSLSLITDDLVGQMLARKDHLEPADHALLSSILKRFEAFTEVAGETNEAMEIRADGFRRVGNLQRRLGQTETALKSYRSANSLLSDLIALTPDDRQLREAFASVISNIGLAEAERGNDRAALESYSTAVLTLRELNRDPDASNFNLSLMLAQLLGNRANVYSRLAEVEQAESDYLAALRLLESDTKNSDSPDLQRELARQRSGFASIVARNPKRKMEATAIYRQSVDGYRMLAARSNTLADVKFEFSSALANQGAIHSELRNREDALECYGEAASIAERLVDDFPGFFRYRLLLGRNWKLLGKELLGQAPKQGKQVLTRSEQLLRTLLAEQPDNQRVQRELAGLLTIVAGLKEENEAASIERFEDALTLRKKLLAFDPENNIWANERIATEINFANHLRTSGEYASATRHYSELLAFLESRTSVNPRLQRATLFGLADCHSQLGEFVRALEYWERLAKNTTDPAHSKFELQRAICLVRTGKRDAGLAAAEKAAAAFGSQDPVIYYDAACCFALAIENETAGDTTVKIDDLRKNAMALLEKAASNGFFNAPQMRGHAATDHDLESLRSHPDFQSFAKKYNIADDAETDF